MKKIFLALLMFLVSFIFLFVALPNGVSILGFSGDAFFKGEWWRIFTFSFIHISNAHLIENAFSLFVVSLLAYEFELGVLEFSLLFILSSIFIALVAGMILPYILIAGASLGLFGLFGALAFQGKEFVSTSTFFIVFGSLILINMLYNLMFDLSLAQPAYHAAGFFTGAMFFKVKNYTIKKKKIRVLS
jgi:rhomboid protease GluP